MSTIMRHLFSFQGRLKRWDYVWISWLTVLSGAALGEGCVLALRKDPVADGAWIGFATMAVLSAWPMCALVVKRCHDLGLSGWFVLLILVPWLGYLAQATLVFWRGSDSPNRFGPSANQETP